MSAISFKETNKTFRGKGAVVHALKSLSMDVSAGSIFGLAGVNGAGKTTAVKIILGISRPDNGEIKVNGLPPLEIDPSQVGFAPEIADVPDFLTVEEVLVYSCALLNYKLDKSRLDQVIDLLDLADSRALLTGSLSKGTRQRVSLAAAIAHDPDLIIFDEPTSGLDPLGRKLVKTLLKQLKAEGKTVFFSTHILTDLQEVCDQMGILHQGKMIFSGSPSDFIGDSREVSLDQRFEKLVEDFSANQENVQ